MTETIELKQEGELNASEVVKYFDNIKNAEGKKLTQSEKRGYIRFLFAKLCEDNERNKCILANGKVVPIVVHRRQEGRAAAYYLNTAKAPKEEILRAFAQRVGAEYKTSKPKAKNLDELIVSDVKHLLDDIKSEEGKKLSGFKKQDKLNNLFRELYHTPSANKYMTPDGEIPIIVERLGVNNKTAYCLNCVINRQDILEAFAKWAGCKYCPEKENKENLAEKQEGELTARECAKIFHKVENRGMEYKKYGSEKILAWFNFIYRHEKLNQAELPNGSCVTLVVRRRSYSQECLCLNTADEIVKPFVLKRMAEITKSEICIENLRFNPQSKTSLYRSIVALNKAAQGASQEDEQYYRAYAQKAYQSLSPQSKEITVSEWLAKIAQNKKSK